MSVSPSRLWLAAAFALAANVGFRSVCELVSERAPAARQLEADSKEYLELAASLGSRHEFGRSWRVDGAPDSRWVPELGRTPAYPALLAAVGMLTSREGTATIVLQHVLSLCLIGGAVFLVSSSASAPASAPLALLLLALDLQGIAYANRILTETLYAFVLFSGVAASAWAVSRRSIRIAAVAGLCLGLSSLVRPTSFALPFVVGALLCLVARGDWRGSRLRACAVAATVAMTGAVVTGAWTMRNRLVCGEARLSSLDRYNLVIQHGAGALVRSQGLDIEAAQRKLFEAIGLSAFQVWHLPLSPEQNARVRQVVARAILEHKLAFAEDWLIHSANTFFGPDRQILEVLGLPEFHFGLLQEGGGLAQVPPVVWALLITQLLALGVTYVLVGRAILDVVRRRHVPVAVPICLAVAAYVLLVQGGRPGDPRLRYPAVPLLAIAGALTARRTATNGSDDSAASPP